MTTVAPRGSDLRLLDIGGASSLYPATLAQWGRVTVIEPDAQSVATAKEVLGTDIRQGSLPDALGVEGPFDVISEHSRNKGPLRAPRHAT